MINCILGFVICCFIEDVILLKYFVRLNFLYFSFIELDFNFDKFRILLISFSSNLLLVLIICMYFFLLFCFFEFINRLEKLIIVFSGVWIL